MKKLKGFTLIELVVVIGIASVLMVGMSRAVETSIKRFNQLRTMYIALNLAKRQLAILNNLTIANLPAVGTQVFTDTSFPGFFERLKSLKVAFELSG